MIPQDTVTKILDSAQIVDVVSDFVSLKRRGANFIAAARSITKRRHPSMSLRRKAFTSASVAESQERRSVSSWSTRT